MKLYLALSICVALFSSCLTESKVNRWLNEHKTKAAGYCTENFPPDTIAKTVVENIDSAGYFDAYMNMSYLADSLMNEIQRKATAATPDRPYKPNIDSIRAAVDKEIRKRLKPCIDTVKVVTNTVIDRARERQLQGIAEEKNNTISARDKRITDLETKVKARVKWIWMFWVLVAMVGGYTLLKLRFKLPI